jgi:hypothetical protein
VQLQTLALFHKRSIWSFNPLSKLKDRMQAHAISRPSVCQRPFQSVKQINFCTKFGAKITPLLVARHSLVSVQQQQLTCVVNDENVEIDSGS